MTGNEHNDVKKDWHDETHEKPAKVKHEDGFYFRYWKVLTIPMIVFFIISIIILMNNLYTTGTFVERDIELRGGTLVTVALDGPVDLNDIGNILPEYKISLVTGVHSSLLVEADIDADADEIISKLAGIGIDGESSIRSIGPSLGEVFWQQAQIALIVAFILMGIVIFIIFRSTIPSLAVILAAITDIAGALVGMHFFGIELSLAALAALLTLIGYSVDTDVLLTTEIMKSNKPIKDRIKTALKTGLTMTITTLAVLGVMYLVSGNTVIQSIAAVLFIGLVIDIPVTWLTNVGLMRYWVDKKERV